MSKWSSVSPGAFVVNYRAPEELGEILKLACGIRSKAGLGGWSQVPAGLSQFDFPEGQAPAHATQGVLTCIMYQGCEHSLRT